MSCVHTTFLDKYGCFPWLMNVATGNIIMIAKCSGLAGTVPEFGPMSRMCPGLPDFVQV